MWKWEEEAENSAELRRILAALTHYCPQHRCWLELRSPSLFHMHMGYPTCSRSLSLVQSSISERKETLPSAKEERPPNQALRCSGRTTGAYTLSLLSPPSTLNGSSSLFGKKNTQKNKLQIASRSQERLESSLRDAL